MQYPPRPDQPPPLIQRHVGDRAALRPLFRLADDSEAQIDSYLHLGDVLVAHAATDAILGHAQLLATADAAVLELKSLAVRNSLQRRGLGRTLVTAALAFARTRAATRVTVATACADVGVLYFYQRLGFRLSHIERDAFTPATGYPAGLTIDGIPLRDRAWLDIAL